jgi:hypothetical protein
MGTGMRIRSGLRPGTRCPMRSWLRPGTRCAMRSWLRLRIPRGTHGAQGTIPRVPCPRATGGDVPRSSSLTRVDASPWDPTRPMVPLPPPPNGPDPATSTQPRHSCPGCAPRLAASAPALRPLCAPASTTPRSRDPVNAVRAAFALGRVAGGVRASRRKGRAGLMGWMHRERSNRPIHGHKPRRRTPQCRWRPSLAA